MSALTNEQCTGERHMKALLGAAAGLAIWAVLFLLLPQEFLGTVVAAVALIALPIMGAKAVGDKR